MTDGLSRRALAAGAAALAAAGLGPEPGSAGRRCRARKQHTTHVGTAGRVELDESRFVVERVTHVARFHHDDAAWEWVHPHDHHRTLVPEPGSTLLCAIHGLAIPELPEGDGPGEPETFTATFSATGGSYDPATGRLVLEGEGHVEWPDAPPGRERRAFLPPPGASSFLLPAA